MFVDGGKEFRGFKVSRDFKEGLRMGRGQDALAPAGLGEFVGVFYTRARCPPPRDALAPVCW